MSRFEGIYLWLVLVGLVVNGLGLLFVAQQVRLARQEGRQAEQTREAELLRRRRQATLDFYSDTIQVRRDRGPIPTDTDTESIRSLILRLQQGKDAQLRGPIARRLSYHEILGTGVRAGIFDLEVADMLAGGRIIKLFENYYPWIQDRRETLGRPSLYQELEWLAGELAGRRGVDLNRTSESLCERPPDE